MPTSELTPEQELKLLTLTCMAPLVARPGGRSTVSQCCGSTIGAYENELGLERPRSSNGFVFAFYHGEDIKNEVPYGRDFLLIPDTNQNIVVDWAPK